MIAYRQLTVADKINEMVLRMGKYRTGLNIDWTTMLRFVNRAITEVMVMTIPYKDWAYVTQLTVTDGTIITNRFLKPI